MWPVFLALLGLGFGENFHEQLSMFQQEPLIPLIAECLLTGGLGALVGATLWLIARPDRQTKLSFPAERAMGARGEGNPGV